MEFLCSLRELTLNTISSFFAQVNAQGVSSSDLPAPISPRKCIQVKPIQQNFTSLLYFIVVFKSIGGKIHLTDIYGPHISGIQM